VAQNAPVLIAAEKAEQLPAPDRNEKKSRNGKDIVPGPPAYAIMDVSCGSALFDKDQVLTSMEREITGK
jgi:hypothetical protein